MSKTLIQAELPRELIAGARSFIADGWASDFDELLAEALSHSWSGTQRAQRGRS